MDDYIEIRKKHVEKSYDTGECELCHSENIDKIALIFCFHEYTVCRACLEYAIEKVEEKENAIS